MKSKRCWPLTILLFVIIGYLCINPLFYYLEKVIRLKKLKSKTQSAQNSSNENSESKNSEKKNTSEKKSNEKNKNLKLDRELLKDISKHDWPDYDFRFKKKNMILVYGWDKYCFEI